MRKRCKNGGKESTEEGRRGGNVNSGLLIHHPVTQLRIRIGRRGYTKLTPTHFLDKRERVRGGWVRESEGGGRCKQ